jgi:tRNA (adenine37-N6)-methyltransferase
MDAPYCLTPIGVVHSPVTDRRAMPVGGVPAEIEVFAPFRAGLLDIGSNSHVVALVWLHESERDRLQARGRNPPPDAPLRGVFGLRSQMRPNPIGLTVARLLAADEPGGRLRLDALDFIDGTPVIDLKRYSPGIDSVFAARTSRDLRTGPPESRAELIRQAVSFHGAWAAGVAVGVALLEAALSAWRIDPRHPGLRVRVGRDGALADALQGMTGATWGTGRLAARDAADVALAYDGETWEFTPAYDPQADPEQIVATPLERLGALRVERDT